MLKSECLVLKKLRDDTFFIKKSVFTSQLNSWKRHGFIPTDKPYAIG